MDPPKYETKKLSFSIYSHKITPNQFQLTFPEMSFKKEDIPLQLWKHDSY
jgi:hypothetical protein